MGSGQVIARVRHAAADRPKTATDSDPLARELHKVEHTRHGLVALRTPQPAIRRPNATFSLTVLCGNRL